MMKKSKNVLVCLSVSLLALLVLMFIVSSIGTMVQSVKMARTKTEHLLLTTSLTLNELSVGLREDDILEEEQDLLMYLKNEDSLIEGIQSVERENNYLYIDVVLVNHEFKRVAYPIESIYRNIPSLGEKENKQDMINKDRRKEIELEVKKNEEKQSVIEETSKLFRKMNFIYWLKRN
jgi:hypothetical protein